MTQDPEYGNRMIHAEIQNFSPSKAEFTLEYKITRREYSRGDYAQLERTDQKPAVVLASMTRLIAPDALIPTDGKIKHLAVEVTGSKSGTVAKAKAAYDYVFTNRRYDKTGSGWDAGMRCGSVTPSAATVQTSSDIRRHPPCPCFRAAENRCRNEPESRQPATCR